MRPTVIIRLVPNGPIIPLILGIIMGLGLMASPLMAKRALTTGDWLLTLGGGTLVALFGVIVFVWPMLDRRPRVILDKDGLRMPLKTGALIPWEHVEHVYFRPRRNRQSALVTIVVRDMDLPKPGRANAVFGKGFRGVLQFWPDWLDGNWQGLKEAICSFAPEVKITEGGRRSF